MATVGLLGVHDVGGTDEYGRVPHWPDTHEHYQHWERATHALLGVLSRKQLVSLDEVRLLNSLWTPTSKSFQVITCLQVLHQHPQPTVHTTKPTRHSCDSSAS